MGLLSFIKIDMKTLAIAALLGAAVDARIGCSFSNGNCFCMATGWIPVDHGYCHSILAEVDPQNETELAQMTPAQQARVHREIGTLVNSTRDSLRDMADDLDDYKSDMRSARTELRSDMARHRNESRAVAAQ